MGERTKLFSRVLESSEMYCSLKYENVRGCPYDKFTPREIVGLTVASTVCAILSLVPVI